MKQDEDWFGQIPPSVAKALIANSIACAASAAKLLGPLRGGDPRVEEWFALGATRAALQAVGDLDGEQRSAVLAGPPSSESETDADRRPVTAQMLAEFAVEEGYSYVAIVALKVTGVLPPIGPGTLGVTVNIDVAALAAQDAPPITGELVHAMRKLADGLEKNEAKAGEGTVKRVVLDHHGKGGN
jgi:hypothetical protein